RIKFLILPYLRRVSVSPYLRFLVWTGTGVRGQVKQCQILQMQATSRQCKYMEVSRNDAETR
ncbi:MAG: hypothetical protein PVI17_14020, partial [Syntrophobacterales bacterium]